MAHVHLFRHQQHNQTEQVGVLCIRGTPSTVKGVSSIQINGLNVSKGKSLNQKLECMVASQSGGQIDLHLCSTDCFDGAQTRSKADGASLLIPSALIDRFQPTESKCTFDAQLRTETTQFLRQNEQLYKELVPEEHRASELKSYVASGGVLPQIQVTACKASEPLASSSCAAQINGEDVAAPRFQVDTATVAGDCCCAKLSQEALQDTNRVLKGIHLTHRLQHYLCSHSNASDEDKRCFGKACRQMLKGSDQLLLKSMTGQLFSQGKASSIQLPQCSGNSVLTTSKSGALTVPIQLLTDSISIHIPQSTVKLGHGKLGFGIHARLQEASALPHVPHTELHTTYSGAQIQNSTKNSAWHVDVQGHTTGVLAKTRSSVNYVPRNRFSAASLKHDAPEQVVVSTASGATGNPYVCALDAEKGHLWLQRDQLLNDDTDASNRYNDQLHHFDASVYSLRDSNDFKQQYSAADLLLGTETATGERPNCFKPGTKVVNVYPSAACIMARHGPTGPAHPQDDVLFMHPHRLSLCDEELMRSLHSQGELHKRMSVRHSLARHLNVDPCDIQLGTHEQAVRSINSGRRRCMLTQPLNNDTMATWSATPYMFQGKKLHNFAVDFEAPGCGKQTAVMQVNTCPSDRQDGVETDLDFQKHSGVQVLTLV